MYEMCWSEGAKNVKLAAEGGGFHLTFFWFPDKLFSCLVKKNVKMHPNLILTI